MLKTVGNQSVYDDINDGREKADQRFMPVFEVV
jgi:hypothetical protein